MDEQHQERIRSMNKSLIMEDWREKAAAAAQGTVADDMAVEKAFMDQAYSAVQNKCGPLMRSPHQIGFEIVHKNDAATRMVGIFGFRAGRQLFYAPVFFLSGEIKGTDLLYRHLTKTFVPLSEDWVVYLIEGAKSEMGRGISKQETAKLPVRMDLQTMAYPPMTGANYMHKGAAIDDEAQTKAARRSSSDALGDAKRLSEIINRVEKEKGLKRTGLLGKGHSNEALDIALAEYNSSSKKDEEPEVSKEAALHLLGEEGLFTAWESYFDEMEKPAAIARPGIKDVILHIGPPAVEKLASLMEQSLAFATELHRCIPEEDWMPVEMLERTKSAGEVGREVPVLTLSHVGISPEFAKFGFEMVDQRAPEKVNTVYENDAASIQRASEPGRWSLLMADGGMEEALLFYSDENWTIGRQAGSNNGYGLSEPIPYTDPSCKRMVVVMVSGKQSSEAPSKTLHGIQDDTSKELFASDAVTDKMSKGKGYRAVDPHTAVASRPFVVVSKSTRSGITEYRIRTHGYGEERIVVVNPDAPRNDFETGVFNETMRFVEVKLAEFKERTGEDCCAVDNEYDLKFDEDISLGNEDTVDAWLRTAAPVKKASIFEDPLTGEVEIRYDRQIMRGLSKMAAAGVLAGDLHIDRDTTFQLLGDLDAVHNFRRDFTVWEKVAAQRRLVEEPSFQTYTDQDFGMVVDPAQQFILRSQWEGPEVPQPRIGDAWDPTQGQRKVNEGLGNDQLLNMQPDQIAQLAQQGDMPAVFEHGVIGSLVHTFDANALVAGYLPKLEDAVDALGRTMFLFYWKPTDFEMSYGADDMMQIENQLTSNFKSLGAVLLELLRRSQQHNQGNNSSGKG
jgi:hypothetical protein